MAEFVVDIGFVGDRLADFVAEGSDEVFAHLEGCLSDGAAAESVIEANPIVRIGGEAEKGGGEAVEQCAFFKADVADPDGVGGAANEGAGPATVEAFLRGDVGGDRCLEAVVREFVQRQRDAAAAPFLPCLAAKLIDPPVIERGEQKRPQASVAGKELEQGFAGQEVVKEALDVVGGLVTFETATAEKGEEGLPVGCAEVLHGLHGAAGVGLMECGDDGPLSGREEAALRRVRGVALAGQGVTGFGGRHWRLSGGEGSERCSGADATTAGGPCQKNRSALKSTGRVMFPVGSATEGLRKGADIFGPLS